jgi:hypothetical protein
MNEAGDLLVKDYSPKIMLKSKMHIPERGRYPVIDAHNHLFEETDPGEMVDVMDQVGISTFINVTGNTRFTFVESGYTYFPRDVGVFIDRYMAPYPDFRRSCGKTS